jgi:hypothetical protein
MNSKLLVLCLALVLSSGLITCPAAPDTSVEATNILRNLLTTKTLLLSSRPKFIIQTSHYNSSSEIPDFAHIDIVAPKMIQQFGFKARLSRSGYPMTVMQVAANKDHTTVLIETSEGLPYCVMTDHFLIMCDPDHPGGLVYNDEGTVLWGFLQGVDRTKAFLQMTFLSTNVPPAAILDLDFSIKSMWAKKTNVSYLASDETVKILTRKSSLEVRLSQANSQDEFGVKELKLQGSSGSFDFTDFQIGAPAEKGLLQLSERDLEDLNLPLRKLDTGEFGHLGLFVPEGIFDTAVARQTAEKLQSLVSAHLSK